MVDDSLGEAIDGGEAIETVQAQRAPFHTPVCAKLIADRPPAGPGVCAAHAPGPLPYSRVCETHC